MIGLVDLINSLFIMKTLICKIPPNLPLPAFGREKIPKGGIIPLFGKEGRPACAKPRLAGRKQGGDFLMTMSIQF